MTAFHLLIRDAIVSSSIRKVVDIVESAEFCEKQTSIREYTLGDRVAVVRTLLRDDSPHGCGEQETLLRTAGMLLGKETAICNFVPLHPQKVPIKELGGSPVIVPVAEKTLTPTVQGHLELAYSSDIGAVPQNPSMPVFQDSLELELDLELDQVFSAADADLVLVAPPSGWGGWHAYKVHTNRLQQSCPRFLAACKTAPIWTAGTLQACKLAESQVVIEAILGMVYPEHGPYTLQQRGWSNVSYVWVAALRFDIRVLMAHAEDVLM